MFRRNGFYVVALVCVLSLTAAIGIVGRNISKQNNISKENEVSKENDILNENDESTVPTNNNVHISIDEKKTTDESLANKQNDQTVMNNNTKTLEAFQTDSKLMWPVNGTIIMDYSMSTTTYYKTLDQYKCNPALLISSTVDENVACAYQGTVENITGDAKIGLYVVIDHGNDYRSIYGQLKDIKVEKGQVLQKGEILGKIAVPTRYFIEEGPHLYFEFTNDETPIDPKPYLTATKETSETK